MALICLRCLDIFENIPEEYRHTACRCLYREIIEVDDLFAPIIRILNRKGYTTDFCCSGHYTSRYRAKNSSYITFANNIELPYLPSEYGYDHDNLEKIKQFKRRKVLEELLNSNTIRRYFLNNGEDVYFEIIENAKNMLSWAKSLPERK